MAFPKNSYGQDFGGLGVSSVSSEYTLIDDAPGGEYWWMAIGARQFHGGVDTIPGPHNINVKEVELFVQDPGTVA